MQNKKIALMIDVRADNACRAELETSNSLQPQKSSHIKIKVAKNALIEQDIEMEPETATRKRKAKEEHVAQCKARDQRHEKRWRGTKLIISKIYFFDPQLKDEAKRRDALKRKSSSKPVHKIEYWK